MFKNILILGTGAWGTGIAQILTDNGNKVYMYGNDISEVDDIQKNHENSKYFKNIIKEKHYLSENIKTSNDLEFLVKDWFNYKLDLVIIAVPTNAVRSVLTSLKNILEDNNTNTTIFINLAKGYSDTCESMQQVFRSIFKEDNYYYYSLLGPSHAEEVIQRKLTCVNLVAERNCYIASLKQLFTNDYFKVHTDKNLSLNTAEFSSSMKNVYALMSGILSGLGYGQNARAALLTYSYYEMNLLTNFDKSLKGLCGLGDLVVTCYSKDSRNFTAGEAIGKLNSFDEFEKTNTKTVEGIRAINFTYNIMDKRGFDLIIIKTAYNIVNNKVSPKEAIIKMFEQFNNNLN